MQNDIYGRCQGSWGTHHLLFLLLPGVAEALGCAVSSELPAHGFSSQSVQQSSAQGWDGCSNGVLQQPHKFRQCYGVLWLLTRATHPLVPVVPSALLNSPSIVRWLFYSVLFFLLMLLFPSPVR